ncbi:hypothetical protein EJ03DRAFT_370739 [Teratosphaeria nubilosa]|uniref:Uncharacterized protein n=1 Tax=Teratosphaeria nubilosa TaxID=161662 RepID=A0A6G1LLP3_9PEZI|nr:hypothetical protein EJ03DRAFT_370739 [Teratosphaeria nubilosa]
MDEPCVLLGVEIDRILDSLYPTQLKSLRDLVTSRCSDADVNKCLQTRACRCDHLARCLLEGLRQWPYVLDVITKLCRNVLVRDALLKHEPKFVNELVVEALKSDGLKSKYAAATVSMLSHRLPDGVTLPSQAQTLFLRLVDNAAHKPSTATLKPVHSLLKGTSGMLLGLLSNRTLCDFEEKLFQILHNSTRRPPTDEDPLLTLYCLAIMRIVTSASDESLMLTDSFDQTQERLASTQPTSPKWNATEMEKFFSSSTDAPRTINLLCLKTMWACATSTESLKIRLEVLRLVGDLIAAIPSEIKDTWCLTNSALMQKIQQKASACSTDGTLQVKAFAFVTQLCKPVYLQMSSIELARSSVSSIEMLAKSFDEDSGTAWTKCVSALVDSSTSLALVNGIMELVMTARPLQLLRQSAALILALQTVGRFVEDRQDIAGAGRIELSSTKTIQRLHQLTEQIRVQTWDEQDQGAELSACRVAWSNARNGIAHELNAFFLRCLLSRQEVETADVSPSAGVSLLELHALSARCVASCTHSRGAAISPVTTTTIVEDNCSEVAYCSDWRQALHKYLGNDASMKESAIQKLFAKACEDLEKRCEGVEEPLRQEQEARSALQDQYCQLQDSYAHLESECIDSKLRHASVVGEKDELMLAMGALQRRADEVVERAQDLEQMLRSSTEDSDRELREMRQAMDAAELEHVTAFASKEEDLEELEAANTDLRRRIDQTKSEIEEVNRTLTGMRGAKNDLEIERHSLQAEHENLVGDHQRLKEQVHELRNTIKDHEQSQRDILTHRDAADAALAKLKDEFRNERRAHEQQLHQERAFAKANIQAANASHSHTMDRLAAQHGEEAAGLQRQLADLRAQIQHAEQRHRAELSKREDEADGAQKQLGRMQRRLRQKDQQIQDANAMRQNLMAAMGLGDLQQQQQQQQASLPHRTRASVARTLPQSQVDGQPTPPTPTSADLEGSLAEFDPRASITSDQSRRERTPNKRARARKSSKASSPAKTRFSGGARTRVSTDPVARRRPVQEIDGNRSPRKSGPKTRSASGSDEFDGSVFDESELFDRHDVRMYLGGLLEDEEETEV